MNTILRVYNQNNEKYDLDLFQDQDFLLDISAKEAGEIPSIFGISSQNIALPGTNKNNEYFGNLWNLGSTGNTSFIQRYACQVLEDGTEIFTGKIYLDSVVTDQNGDTLYNVIVTDEVVDFKTQIENLTWNEVFSYFTGSAAVPVPQVNAGWNHAFNYTNISSSWNLELPQIGTGIPPVNNFGLPEEGDIVYPLAEYGFKEDSKDALLKNGGVSGSFTNHDTPFSVTQFKPAIRVNAMMKALMRFTGFEYTSSFLDSDYFNTIYQLSTPSEVKGPTTSDPISASFLATNLGNTQDIPGNNVIDQIVEFPVEVNDPLDLWNPTTSTYTAPATGEYGFQGSLLYAIINTQNPTERRQVVFTLLINGQRDSRIENINFNLTKRNTAGNFPLNWDSVQLNAGDTVQLAYSNAFYRVNEFVRFFGTDVPFFECYKSPSVSAGSNVDMSLQFGDDTVSDWLKGLIQKFNLVIEPVKGKDNLLRIEPFNDWRDLGDTVDWTDKVDRSVKFKINHPMADKAKTVYFSDEEDEDEFNRYSIEELGKTFGNKKYIADTTVLEGETQVGTYFAPTPMKYIQGTQQFVVPQIYTVDNGVGEIRPLKFKPRLLHYVNSNGVFAEPTSSIELVGVSGSASVSGSWFLDDQQGTVHTMTVYPQFHHISQLPADQTWEASDNPSTTRDLHFGNLNHYEYHQPFVNAQTHRDAVYEYWASYLNEIYDVDSRLLTCNIVLNPVEIGEIALNDKIFIDGHYYRINKINGASLTNELSTEVELIKAGSRRNPFTRRRINKVIGGGGSGGSDGGGSGGGVSGDDYMDDIIIGEWNSNGRVVYVNYNSGDVVTEFDYVEQASWKDGVSNSNDGAYFYTPKTQVPTSNVSIGQNYIDSRNVNTFAIGYYNNVQSADGTNVIYGNNNVLNTDGGVNVLFANNTSASFSTDLALTSSIFSNNFVVALSDNGQKDLTNITGGVILNPIKPVSGSQYSDKVVTGDFISQGTASFEDSVIITGSLTVNGTEVVPVDTGSFESKTRFNHLFGTDPTAVTFATVSNMTGDNRGVKLDYVLFSGSATNVGQLQVTGDGVSITSVDKVVERNITGAPTSSFTAAYNASDVEVKATFIGSDYTISGSIITMI